MSRLRWLLGLGQGDDRHSEWAWITRGWDTSAAIILTVGAFTLTVFRAYGSPSAFERFQWGLGNHPRFQVFGELWWFACSAVLLGLIPFLVTRWLARRDPSIAAETGLGLGDRAYGLKGTAVLLGVMLPVVFAVSRSPAFYNYYPLCDWLRDEAVDYATAGQPADWLAWLVLYQVCYAVYFLGWEYFFRGYLTFGLHARIGILGIFVGNIPFALMHANKPFAEAMGSIVAGLALGLFALRCRSFWYAWVVHAVVALAMDLFALERRMTLGG